MAQQEPAPWVRPALEFGPLVIFFIGYMRVKDLTVTIGGTEYEGLIIAAAGLVPLLLISNFFLLRLTGSLSRIQVFTLVMVIITTGLTVWFNDESFYKMKTTLVYGTYATILTIGLLMRRSFLEYAIGEHMDFQHEGWMILTRRLTVVYVILAIFNEILWRNWPTEVWVPVETFGFPVFMAVFLFSQIVLLRGYMTEAASDEGGDA